MAVNNYFGHYIGAYVTTKIGMRLWSLHPKYLDAKGIVACWREGLLARKVLLRLTRGYRNHPQLDRFKVASDPLAFIDTYLDEICIEAERRGYKFDRTKIGPRYTEVKLAVTTGQLLHEFEHLRLKLKARDPSRFEMLFAVTDPLPHPLFDVISGPIEPWERI